MEERTGKPTFNIALGYTNFLLYSLHLCSEYSRNRDYEGWFFELLVLYRWLSTRIKGDIKRILENKTVSKEDKFNKIEEMINEIEPMISKKFIDHYKLYKRLHIMEMFLREAIKDAGLEMKEEEDILQPEEEW